MDSPEPRKIRKQIYIPITKHDSRIEFRIGEPYRKMLAELSKSSKLKMSEISRNIFEPAIKRRYNRMLKRIQQKKRPKTQKESQKGNSLDSGGAGSE